MLILCLMSYIDVVWSTNRMFCLFQVRLRQSLRNSSEQFVSVETQTSELVLTLQCFTQLNLCAGPSGHNGIRRLIEILNSMFALRQRDNCLRFSGRTTKTSVSVHCKWLKRIPACWPRGSCRFSRLNRSVITALLLLQVQVKRALADRILSSRHRQRRRPDALHRGSWRRGMQDVDPGRLEDLSTDGFMLVRHIDVLG